MISNSMTLSILNFSYLAFGCLSLAMFSHFRGAFKRSPNQTQSRVLYWSGWIILAASYYAGVVYQGFAYGSILFTGLLSLAGLLVILTLSYRAHHLPHFMTGSGVLGTLLQIFA
ncbi:conserved hypothetical protein [Shewanella sediminis HAW-EB3]|uniref:DUF3325 domain-containing protein n=1 Tax=Shewanella sediminis (strain HAW-EB3) TaxID=425104 RepID=A8FSY1_SHESH|nr:DUF3325 domain-containing protein [Shewanella sediminis]ABV35954.1 conserved hypothetical protein [Shewanella sediminis HAW-EB3]